MNLEQRVTEGYVAYIKSFIFNADTRMLRVSFMRADIWEVYGTLTFRDVRGYRFEFDTEEDQQEVEAGMLIEGLIGIEEMGAQADPNYYIRTDAREIAFSTAVSPIWSPVGVGKDVSQ